MNFLNLFSRYDSRHSNGISTKNKDFVHSKNTKGITLVALVVTIVVLLILAGITITMLFGENGIIKKAQDAADATKNDQDTTVNGLKNLENQMNEALNEGSSSSGEGGGGSGGTEVTIPEGLEVGSTVSYKPSGTYNWQTKYCSSNKTETTDDVTLSSTESQDFNIQEWKVLSIDETTKNVTLVPSNPTSKTVDLGNAQGYNNGVKLLNDACSSLYGNTDKGISARSINIGDIEDYMLPEKLTEVTGPSTYYKKQKYSSAYTTAKSKYPVIYAYEKLSVINADPGKEKTLDLGDSPESFIETTDEGAINGIITTATNIQPYQTYWYKDSTYMSTAFKPFDEANTDKGNYYSLIMPKGTSTTYWVASRCIDTRSNDCNFCVRYVYSGGVFANIMFNSSGTPGGSSFSLFPVITLSSGLIEGDTTSGFSVK